MRIECKPPLVVSDVSRLEIERLQGGRSPAAVDGKIGADRHRSVRALRLDFKAFASPSHRLHLVSEPDIHAKRPGSLNQHGDQVRIEAVERLRLAIEQRDLGAGPCRQMGELEADIAAADQYDATRQRRQVQEGVAGGQVLHAFDRQLDGLGPGSDDDMCRPESLG